MECYQLTPVKRTVRVVSFSDGKLMPLSQRHGLCYVKQNIGEGGKNNQVVQLPLENLKEYMVLQFSICSVAVLLLSHLE